MGAVDPDGEFMSHTQILGNTANKTPLPIDSDSDEDLTPSKMDELRKRAEEIAKLVNVKEWNPSRESLTRRHQKEPSLPPSTPMERAKRFISLFFFSFHSILFLTRI